MPPTPTPGTVLERAAVADLDVDPEVEARNLIAAAVRRELAVPVAGGDPARIRDDAEARLQLEDLGQPIAGASAGRVVARLAPSPHGATSSRGELRRQSGPLRRPSRASTPQEWAELTERGRATGTVHAEDVALVLRNVELTGDVLEATRDALSGEGIRIEEEVEEDDDDDDADPTSPRPLPPFEQLADDPADERLLSRRRRSRATRADESWRRLDVGRRAHVPARDRPGRPADHRGRAAARPADRGRPPRRPAHRRRESTTPSGGVCCASSPVASGRRAS